MSRPGPRPSAPEHRQHDLLLVAQHVAGDLLEEARQSEARALLASCPDCAALAADLNLLSSVVAREPVPPRRRDFRLDAEQAERVRGGPLSRWLGRLRLPRSRAFAPAAAGMLSLGLAFVVVGYAWPEDGSVGTGSDANVVPAAAVEGAAPAAPDLETIEQASPPAAETPMREELTLEELTIDEPEGLAQHQAGTSARSGAKKAIDGLAADADMTDEDRALGALEAEPPDQPASFADAVAAGEAASGESPLDGLPVEEPAAEALPAEAPQAGAERPGGNGDASLAGGATDDAVTDGAVPLAGEDLGVETVLLAVGVVLAVGGALLLLLAWLVRRRADPLLR